MSYLPKYILSTNFINVNIFIDNNKQYLQHKIFWYRKLHIFNYNVRIE